MKLTFIPGVLLMAMILAGGCASAPKVQKAKEPPSPAVTESGIEVPLPEHTPYDASPKLKEIYLRGYVSGYRVGISGYWASCDTAGSKEHPEYGEALTSGNFAGQEAGSLVYAAKHPSTD